MIFVVNALPRGSGFPPHLSEASVVGHLKDQNVPVMFRGERLRTHSALLAFESPGHRPAFWTLGSPTSWRLRQKCPSFPLAPEQRAGSTLARPFHPRPTLSRPNSSRGCRGPAPAPPLSARSARPRPAARLSRPGPADPRVPSGFPLLHAAPAFSNLSDLPGATLQCPARLVVFTVRTAQPRG